MSIADLDADNISEAFLPDASLRASRRPQHLRQRPGGVDPAEARRVKNAVGGSMVSQMKRPMRVRKKNAATRYRTWALVALAMVLFIVLNSAWWSRANVYMQSRGGWGTLLGRTKQAAVDPLRSPSHDEI